MLRIENKQGDRWEGPGRRIIHLWYNSFDKVINTSVRVSPDDKKITSDWRVQAFISQSVLPEIRKFKKTSEKVQNTNAIVSYRSEISVPKALVVSQGVYEILNCHKYLLSDMISLQPLFFALENHEQITKLIIEIL